MLSALPYPYLLLSHEIGLVIPELYVSVLCNKESTSSKKAKTDGREGEEAVKSEVEDDDEQDGNEVCKTHASK
jgi:hypothetical protein